jgi:hypothetical protein
MPALFGELSATEGSAVAIGALFVTFAAACKGVNEILNLLDRTKDKPPVGDQVKAVIEWAEAKFASKHEVKLVVDGLRETIETHESSATEFRNGLKSDVKAVDAKLSSRSGDIFDALRSVQREVSHLNGRLEKSGRLPRIKQS